MVLIEQANQTSHVLLVCIRSLKVPMQLLDAAAELGVLEVCL